MIAKLLNCFRRDTTLGKAMKRLIREHGGMTELHKATGVSISHIHKMMNDPHPNPKQATLDKLGIDRICAYSVKDK